MRILMVYKTAQSLPRTWPEWMFKSVMSFELNWEMWKEDDFPCTAEEDWDVVHHPPKSKPGRTIYPLKSAGVDWIQCNGDWEMGHFTGAHLGLEIDLSDPVSNPRGSIIQYFKRHDAYPLRHSFYTFIKVKVHSQVPRGLNNTLQFAAKREGGVILTVAPNTFEELDLSFINTGDADAVYNILMSLFKDETDN